MIHSLYNPGDLVFDIGAHTGSKTDEFLGNGAKVICFEPNPQLVHHLVCKYKGNPNVTVEDKGVGERNGSLVFNICLQAPTISTYTEHWKKGRFSNYHWGYNVLTDIVTLDAAIEKHGTPKFIKIDTEGFEREVLAGLNKPVYSLSFEFALEYMNHAEECIQKCISLGFTKFSFSLGEANCLETPSWISPENLLLEMKKHYDNSDFWGDIYARRDS